MSVALNKLTFLFHTTASIIPAFIRFCLSATGNMLLGAERTFFVNK
jgi:hypothetical protein